MRCSLKIPCLWQKLGFIPRISGYACLALTLPLAVLLLVVLLLSLSSYHRHDAEPELNTYVPRALAPVAATDKADPGLNYGIVIDCGSSGSRVFVYFWYPHDGTPQQLLTIHPMRDTEGNPVLKKIEPGISAYVDVPSQASEYLEPLLEFASRNVPSEKHQETSLFIMATGGMRMLSESDQESILDDLRIDIPMKFDFLFHESHVEVIPGKQEGIYSWIAINYGLGKFGHELGDDPLIVVDVPGVDRKSHIRKRTVGVLDMGGASIQIAYEVPSSVTFQFKEMEAKDLLVEFNLGCTKEDTDHSYRVYVSTFLGFGANSARDRYENWLRVNQTTTLAIAGKNESQIRGTSPENAIPDPCLPVDMPDTLQTSPKDGTTYYVRGTGDYYQCRELLLPLLNRSVPCLKEPCSMDGVYQPEINFYKSEFYGFSEFYYTMEDLLHIGGKYNQMKFSRAAKEFCQRSWSELSDWQKKGSHPRADSQRYKLQCFKSAWMTAVLHDGLGFPPRYKDLRSLQYIAGQEVHWTLGALLYKTKYYPLRQIEKHMEHHYRPPWMLGELHQASHLVLLCILVVVVAIVMYLRRLRVVPKIGGGVSGIRRVPTMSYFMTEDGQAQEGITVSDASDFYAYKFPSQHYGQDL